MTHEKRKHTETKDGTSKKQKKQQITTAQAPSFAGEWDKLNSILTPWM